MASGTFIPKWTQTVGELTGSGAKVDAFCSSCSTTFMVDLDKVQSEQGEHFSFWNRRPPCRNAPRCQGRMWFRAWPSWTAPYVQLREAAPKVVGDIHQRWRESRAGDHEIMKP